MKTGRTLGALERELERRERDAQDFVCDTRRLSFETATDATDSPVALHIHDNGVDFPPKTLTQHAHRQVGSRLGIPAKYYDRMREEAPDLLCDNVNRWFSQKPERRMVRMLDGNVRAFLSDKYRRIDNFEVASKILPVLRRENVEIVSCEVTDSRLYIKAVNPRVQAEVSKGDVVQAGVSFANSEIGAGAFVIKPLVMRLVCLNGLILPDATFKQNHLGRRANSDEAVYEMLSDEAIKADDEAMLLKARDVTRAALGEAMLGQTVAKLRDSQHDRIEGDLPKAVEVLGSAYGLNGDEQSGILKNIIEGDAFSHGVNVTRFGMVQAVTRLSQDVVSYDRATELEALGGTILDLPKKDWQTISLAA